MIATFLGRLGLEEGLILSTWEQQMDDEVSMKYLFQCNELTQPLGTSCKFNCNLIIKSLFGRLA